MKYLSRPLWMPRNHQNTAKTIVMSKSASMIASRPTIACIRQVESTMPAYAPARFPIARAEAYAVNPPMTIVASAAGRRSANELKPNIFTQIAAIQKKSGG